MDTTNNNSSPVLSALNDPAIARHRQWRMFKDKVAKHSITVGGISIIIAISLIFFYLLYVVLPLFLKLLAATLGYWTILFHNIIRTN